MEGREGAGSPQCPIPPARENASLLEGQPGRGGGGGLVRGNHTGSAKPQPLWASGHGPTTRGWLVGVFTEMLALRLAQLLARDPLGHPQASECQLGRSCEGCGRGLLPPWPTWRVERWGAALWPGGHWGQLGLQASPGLLVQLPELVTPGEVASSISGGQCSTRILQGHGLGSDSACAPHSV